MQRLARTVEQASLAGVRRLAALAVITSVRHPVRAGQSQRNLNPHDAAFAPVHGAIEVTRARARQTRLAAGIRRVAMKHKIPPAHAPFQAASAYTLTDAPGGAAGYQSLPKLDLVRYSIWK
jgi:hypothetical protein